MIRQSARVMTVGLAAVGLIAATIAGCKEEARWKTKAYEERTASGTTGEVPVPKELWRRLVEPDKPLSGLLDDIKTAPTPNEGGGDSAIAKKTIETDLKPVTLYLIEETRGVLGGRNLKISFGPGGGELDLRDFVVESHGAFRIVFEYAKSLIEADPKAKWRTWYLSDAKKRKVGPDSVGAGCNTFMDISTAVNEANAKDGLLFAIGGDRYVSALAGTFFFSVKNGARVEVARITLFDSSKRDLQCGKR